MKKLIGVFLSLALLLALPTAVFAQSSGRYRMDEVSTLGRDETINGNYFAAGEKVEVLGTVNGDIYVAGGFVIVDGVVNGDVLAAGGNVIISGKVMGDVRVAGGDINIESPIAGSATILGGTIDIDDDATIGKGLVVAAGNVNVDANIKGDIDASVGNLRVSDEASVSGTITNHEWPKEKEKAMRVDTAAAAYGMKVGFTLVSLLMTVVIGLLGLKFFPNYMTRGAEVIKTKAWKAFFVGFVSLFVIPIVIAFLFITIIGIPFAIALTVFYVAYILLSNIYVVLWAGSWIMEKMKQKQNAYITFVIGAIAYYIVICIPIVGGIISFVAMLIGFGATLINKKQNYLLGREKNVY